MNEYTDFPRTTHTSLDVLLEKLIDDCWNLDGERELVDAWTCKHTPWRTHIFSDTVSSRGVRTSRTRMAQRVFSAPVISLHLTFSILMFHPPSLLFPHGHFETTFQTSTSSTSLPNFTRPESEGQAHFRTSAEEFGYLADPTHSTNVAPRSSTSTSVWTVTRPSTIRTTTASLTSRKTHARALDCSVFPQCLKPLFRTFLMVSLLFREQAKKACLGKPLQDRERDRKLKMFRAFSSGEFALQRESHESMPRETVARQREREEREGSVISVAESMSRKSRRNSTGSHSLQTHREFFSDERDLREDLERRAQQAVLGENSAQRQ